MDTKKFDIPADKAEALVEVVRFIGGQNWSPATGGNYSLRLDNFHCLITQSSKDKRNLQTSDLMVCNFNNQALDPTLKPSAETALHTKLYQLDSEIGCVLHTHSVPATVLSRSVSEQVRIHGFEMQKALYGNTSHTETVCVSVFDNNQDIPALAKEVERKWQQGNINQPGLLVRGHGLYAWGRDVFEARRHVEGFEFLFSCLWQERLAGGMLL
ncbi:methylthioribulose 1-phosphate dehydratase [Catenovulum sediminis]|uniref:Methylthioribulose-1-phosphate dehydratase n=1 Tax=Catenovulum sediminis TaxID=1740262 RepID=A0ABV1RMI9_9ALTE|nr:methylthioribulose 1-phosphate dehydratase [Catenovulum sediminis]